ncbi:MAG: T9SS type A sorting domain-containing protein, partial [Candidatus Dadabacteria bacterium]
VGGRTRAVAYDVRYGSTKVIISGCVSGGIMRSADGGNTWTLVTPQNDIHSFTALAQDPRPGFHDTWYAGGGELQNGNSATASGAPYRGLGIWKSIDNGASWTKLASTITDLNGTTVGLGIHENFDNWFDYVGRIAVNPLNGDVYVACYERIVRSTNGGSSFQAVFGSTSTAPNSVNSQTDVSISSTGNILVGFNGGHPDASLRGVWISQTGSQNSYTRIAGGQTIGVDSINGWRGNDPTRAGKRILLTFAPSNPNIAYVYYENGQSASGPNPKPEADLFRLDISGGSYTWSNRSANMPDYPTGNLEGVDPLTVQGGYDMLVKVSPSDPNIVYIGGTNLYRSFDGFATTNSIAWINGYAGLSNAAQYPNGHPDLHDLAFNPADPQEAIAADDGGIRKTFNVNAGSGSFIFTPVSWTKVPRYQTLQYYYVTLDPGKDRNNFAGGAQDNGVRLREKIQIFTPLIDSNDSRAVVGGDGCSVGLSRISVTDPNQFLYGGYQLGHVYRVPFQNPSGATEIQPNGLTKNPDYSTEPGGDFITYFRLDPDNTEDLYYVNYNRLFRTTSASSVSAGGWTEMTGVSSAVNPANPTAGTDISIRALAFTRGTYDASHSLYIGANSGRIYRLDNPHNASASTAPSDITPIGMTANSNINDIAVNPNDDNEVLAIVSNYGVINIWWTKNAKSVLPTWVNAEGNLTLPSIRSCAIVVKKDAAGNPVTEYYVGTSIGLYSTTNMTNPTWSREGANVFNYAIVQSLAYRPVDNVMVIGTHGNGMYYTYLGTPNLNIVTGINPVTNDRNFIKAVYPTVSSSRVQYEIGNMIGVKKLNIQLLDLSGKKVYQIQSPYINGSVPLDRFPKGAYMLTIYSDDNKYRHIQKVIKQ